MPRSASSGTARRLLAVVALLVVAVLLVGTRSADAAPITDPVQTVPSANAVLHSAPGAITVYLSDPAATSSGQATVYAADHTVLARSTLTAVPGQAGVLSMPLSQAKLGTGIYSVVWTAGGETGSFAFDVEASGAGPETVTNPKPDDSLDPIHDGVIAWTVWITLMSFVGILVLALVGAGPVARRIGEDVVVGTTRRLVRVAAVAIVLFFPAVLSDLANGEDGFDYGGVFSSLFVGAPGTVTGLELVLGLVAVLVTVPMAFSAPSTRRRGLLTVAATAGGLALILMKVPTTEPTDWPRSIFQTLMWFGHLLGAAVWIGGLVGLLALALPGAVPAAHRSAFWPGTIRRFTVTASSCVAALILSGLWLYWTHVDGVHQLFSTLYGQVLGVKVLVFGGLLLLGMFNQFWLHPKIDALRAAGEHGSVVTLLARHFRTAIALEILLGFAILMIAPFLGGSARNQAFQAAEANLTRTATAGTEQVEFTPSGLQPGLTDYTVRLPDATADASSRQVTVTFGSSQLGVPDQLVVGRALGDGRYRVTGYYTPQVGTWQASVSVDGGSPARFELPITAEAAELGKSTPPVVKASTWAWGIGETILVIAVMLVGYRVSGRIARARVAAATRNKPAPHDPESELVGV